MVLFVGEISREDRYRRAFQEVDLAQTYADLAKAVLQVDIRERAGEIVDHAFQLAEPGRPGPVIVVLPEDVIGLAGPAPAGGAPAMRGALGPGIESATFEVFAAARAPDGPALIELLTSIEDIWPGRRLSALN